MTQHKVVSVAVSHDGRPFVVTATGQIFERVRDAQSAMNTRNQDVWVWREVPPPIKQE